MRKVRGNSRGAPSRRLERAGATAGAVLGLALSLIGVPRLPRGASLGQLPGYALLHGFDPRADAFHLLLFAALPTLGGFLGVRIASLRRREGAGREIGSSTTPPEIRSGPIRRPTAPGAPLPPAAAAHGLVLWTLLVGPLARQRVPPVALLLGLCVLSLSLGTFLGAGDSRRGGALLAAACPVLPIAWLGHRPDWVCLGAALAALVLPILASVLAARRPRWIRALSCLALTVLLPGSVTALAAAAVLHPPRIADLFEDGHALLPASEYLRGGRPYRDIVPGHGLATDGLIQLASLRVFGDDYRGLRRGENLFGLLFWPVFYAIGAAASGSPAVGFGTLLFSFLAFPQYAFPRAMLSLWTLALALHASRSRRPWTWWACGAALPLNFCVAPDFGAYAAAAVCVALWVARGDRLAHARRLLLGAALSAAAIAAVFGALGILGAFAREVFVSTPSLLSVYGLGPPPIGPESSGAGAAGVLFDRTAFLYAFATLAVSILGAFLPRAPAVGARPRAMLPVMTWVVAAMLSVLERQHVGYPFFAVPAGVLLAARWLRGHRPWTGPRGAAAIATVTVVASLWHPRLLATLVAQAVAIPTPLVRAAPLPEPSRARGALFVPADVDLVHATAEMMRRADFRPGETWFDFANVPGLYYLFDRRCPVRYYEVPFYESERGQREVIDALERDRGVRAAFMSHSWAIDGIPSSVRAPRVAAYLRGHFRPFYRAGVIEFWLRVDPPAPPAR